MPRHAAFAGREARVVLRTVRRPPVWATAAVLAGVLGPALVGCMPGSAAGDPDVAPTLPAGVRVELQQLRADVAPRHAQVHVSNGSDEPLRIAAVRVEDDRFDGPAERVVADRVSVVPAGGTVDIRVQLPPVDCTAPSEPKDGRPGSLVVLELVGDAGTTEVSASASDALEFLAPLHVRECLMERVRDAATLEFTGFEASAPGEPASLRLTVTPTGAGAATIVGVEGTNLIEFTGIPGDEDLLRLDLEVEPGEAEPIVVDLPMRPFRCDPHVVQEDKRGTIFDVRVELDGEPGQVELFVGEDMRGRILTWVAEWCGFGD